MSEIEIAAAARNNARWCHAVCAAHGARGEFSSNHWLLRSPAPPYYPNLVSFDPDPAPTLAAIEELRAELPSSAWGVKDSFGVLCLERVGFRKLFDADWIGRPVSHSSQPPPGDRTLRVRTAAQLAAWEKAWGESPGQARIFRPELLSQREIAILAALADDGSIQAGVIANRSEGLVGLSNWFFRGGQGEEAVQRGGECIELARDNFPGLPLVGYQGGRALAQLRSRGFRSLGSLRVWLREG